MRIAQFLPQGGGWGPIDEKAPTRGLGGRETAAVKLALEWARLGHDVTTFCPVEDTSTVRMRDGYAEFVTKDLGIVSIAKMRWDALVLWEEPGVVLVNGVRDSCDTVVCAMQVAHVDSTPEMDELIDAWQVLSPWAGKLLTTMHPYIDPSKLEVLPNCVDWGMYGSIEWERPAGAPPRFVYASSPDRGLIHLLRMWPEIRSRFPGCTLSVAYGIEKWIEATIWGHSMQSEHALEVRETIRQDGVAYLGRIGQDVLAQTHEQGDALLYPCDPLSPTETGCITVMEAMAAGEVCVLTDADCLGSEFAGRSVMTTLPFSPEDYLDAITIALVPETHSRLQRAAREWIESERRWDLVGARWIEMLGRVQGSAEKRSREASRAALAAALK